MSHNACYNLPKKPPTVVQASPEKQNGKRLLAIHSIAITRLPLLPALPAYCTLKAKRTMSAHPVRVVAERRAFIRIPPQEENRLKLLHSATLHYTIFSNHYRRHFCAAASRSLQNKSVKTGTKSTTTQKVKHGIYRKRKSPTLPINPQKA
jgi:hypothetical protein